METPNDDVPRSQGKSPENNLRPHRIKTIPRYLVDYQHDLPHPEPKASSNKSNSSSEESDDDDNKRWERMEAVWDTMLKTMQDMQIAMKETSGAITKWVEKLERACESSSPHPAHSDTPQRDRPASIPASQQLLKPDSPGRNSLPITGQINVAAQEERQVIRTPVNMIRPIDPAVSTQPSSFLVQSVPRPAPRTSCNNQPST